VDASERCAAACQAALALLPHRGPAGDSEPQRLLRQCAELCEVNALALRRGSPLARHTARRCVEACARLVEGLPVEEEAELLYAIHTALVVATVSRHQLAAERAPGEPRALRMSA
jgi:hypothetical protein